jgi:hypothetical protein
LELLEKILAILNSHAMVAAVASLGLIIAAALCARPIAHAIIRRAKAAEKANELTEAYHKAKLEQDATNSTPEVDRRIAGSGNWTDEGGAEGRVPPGVRVASGHTGPQQRVPVQPPPPPGGLPTRVTTPSGGSPTVYGAAPVPPTGPVQPSSGPDTTAAFLAGTGVADPNRQYPPPPFDPKDLRQVWDFIREILANERGTEAWPWEQDVGNPGQRYYDWARAAILHRYGLELEARMFVQFPRLAEYEHFHAWRKANPGVNIDEGK